MLNIPKHTKCIGCGECCGINPLSDNEVKAILKYIENHQEKIPYIQSVIKAKKPSFACEFLDMETKKCSIYEARPIICKIFGVDKFLICQNGNTENLDFRFKIPELSEWRSLSNTDKLINTILNMDYKTQKKDDIKYTEDELLEYINEVKKDLVKGVFDLGRVYGTISVMKDNKVKLSDEAYNKIQSINDMIDSYLKAFEDIKSDGRVINVEHIR